MDELLTTRQVQERLKVDRITIYRMLQDGRLKGIKIGQQWRFPEREIARLLSGNVEPTSATPAEGAVKAFPTHCVQTIQNLFVEIGQLGAVVVDLQGNPLTEPTTACDFCHLLLSSPDARTACQDSWRATVSADAETPFTCHAGLHYLKAEIKDNGEVIGYVLVGQVLLGVADEHAWINHLQKLIARYNQISGQEIILAARQIPIIPNEQAQLIKNWPQKTSAAIEAILRERSGFIDRLQRISQMSQMDSK